MKFAIVFLAAFLVVSLEAAMTKDQKRRAEQYTSIFENDTIELQYDYVEDIDDGRGFTCGRAGFTTATGDAYEVVKKYTDKKKDNPLAKYVKEMKRLADEESDDTSNLDGYESAWKKASKDAVFRQVQDEVVDEVYYEPAMKIGDGVGAKKALTLCALYDTIIQHGEGDDPDSIGALVKKTNKNVGTIKSGTDEEEWLREFLKVRRADLKDPHNKDTKDEWAQSVDRVDAMVEILDDGNMDLDGPIHVKTPNHEATIP